MVAKNLSQRSSTSSASTLVSKAQECLACSPPNEVEALNILENALTSNPEDPETLATLAELLCSASNPHVRNEARAISLFKLSISFQADGGSERYFYLAQTLATQSGGASTAVAVYKLGIDFLEKELVDYQSVGDLYAVKQAKHQAATAHCAIAELYLTDLCDEPGAQDNVAQCFFIARELAPDCFDAHSGYACYLKTIGDIDGAIESASKAMEIFRYLSAASEKSENLKELFSYATEECIDMPEWNSRLALAACLIDLNKPEWVIEITDSLMEEDNQNVEIWHVMACHHYALGALDDAKFCIKTAEELLDTAMKGISDLPLLTTPQSDVTHYINHWKPVLNKLSVQVNGSNDVAPIEAIT